MEAQSHTALFPALRGHQYMNLVTFRKNGEPVRTPVWFAEDDGALYLFTNGETGKVKRIRVTARVQVGPADAYGTALGPESAGEARILTGAEAHWAGRALTRKYGLIKRLFVFVARMRGQRAVYIAVKPMAREE